MMVASTKGICGSRCVHYKQVEVRDNAVNDVGVDDSATLFSRCVANVTRNTPVVLA